jgi:hypothetical protein
VSGAIRRRGARARAAIAVLALAAACNDQTGILGAPGSPRGYGYELVGGDRQSGAAGVELPLPLRVRVTDGGLPLGNRALLWSPTGGGTLLDAVGTDAEGVASARVRLGSTGPQSVTVRVDGDGPAAVFSLRAVAPDYPLQVGEVAIPPEYGIHDTFVRDGIAFVCAWNTGVIIFDVGEGRAGGSPSRPVEIGRLVTEDGGVPGGAAAHNAWWFHNPVTQERRYLFVGQEGPATLFTSASGDIHVVDVADLSRPREVASLRIPGAGAHNFWMDEGRQVLYAAYYNAGVIAVDVSGQLQGSLASRVRAQVAIGGADSTFVWGVQLANGALWANDIVSGFWKLDPVTLQPMAGGRNVPERWGSDLWVHGSYAYTGTWGGRPRHGTGYGDVVNVWRIDGAGPLLASTLTIPNVRTVSDVQVSDDGALLVLTTERLSGQGLHVYDLADPARPVLRGSATVSTGLHTGTVARIGGRLFVFAAKNPGSPALQVYDITP